MKISAAVAMWLCAVFALVCFSVALTAFSGLQTLTDPSEREISLGYGWFWAFLGGVATVFGVLSWMMKTGRLGASE
jgi:hypothetical protein